MTVTSKKARTKAAPTDLDDMAREYVKTAFFVVYEFGMLISNVI
jgi:hypothetical protein